MRTLVGLMVVLVLVASACGSSSSEGTTDGGDGSGADDVTAEDFVNTPLAQALGFDGNADDFQAQEREVQALIVDCMREQGFDYEPETIDSTDFVDPTADIEEEWGSRAFAEKWGLGISTFFERDLGTSTVSVDEAADDDPLADLSDAERDAYYAALYGDGGAEFDSTLSEEEQQAAFEDFEPSGCDAEAREQVYGNSVWEDPELSELLQDLYERVEADPRIVSSESEWSSCMAEQGYTFDGPDELWEDVSQRMEPVWSSMTSPFDDLSEEEYAELTTEELQALESRPQDYDRELLAEIKAYEIDVAVADFDCGVGIRRLYLEVQTELEQAFIDEHGDLIDRVRSGGG